MMKKLLIPILICFAAKAFSQSFDSKIFGDISPRWIGPAVMSGRISCVDVVNSDTKVMYVGSAGGGVWKSEDFGITFKPVFDKYCQSIGAITIDQKHPKTLWVGTGESWVRNSVSIGTGIYKSTDEGLNWTRMGLDSSERIARIAISPVNADVVYVAVPGPLWSDSKHRGVYKTTDGGKSWQQILYTDEKTGCADLAIDPQNPDIVYAAMWQFRRTPYSFTSGGPGSALYKSTDGGKSWKKLTQGLPTTEMGRIALAISPANSNIVYASIEYKESAMFRSSDKGEHWTRTGTAFSIIERPFYFARVVADPRDTNTVYRCGLNLVISRDGGKSFSNAGGKSHGDHHDLWVNPNNTNNLVLCTDGGLYISNNQGGDYYFCRNLPVGQFYHVMYDMDQPYNVYGGLQDNLSWYGPSKTNTGGIGSKLWDPMSFGDGFWTFPDPADNNTAYTEIQGGLLIRYDKQRKILKELTPHPGPNEPKYRFNWNSPFTASIHNPHKLFLGGQYVFVSYDRGESWKKISPDLTTNNPKYQNQVNSGGITADNSAAENFCTVYYIAESQSDSNIIWAGTDDGNIQLTRDGGKTWTNVVQNIKDAPSAPWVSSIETSHFDQGTAYVTLDYHNWGNMRPYVYKTTDYGQSWSRISNDSIKGYCHIIREDPVKKNLLFVGSEFGLFISIDGGASWAQMNQDNNVPDVAVRDIQIQPRDQEVILATHGRALMILDALGLNILRQMSTGMMADKFTLFKTGDYTIPITGFDFSFESDDEFIGSDPSADPVIAYYLKSRQLIGEFKVQVLDHDGSLVNEAPAGKHKGINIVKLPISRKPPQVPPAPRIAAGAIQGPTLAEGNYEVRIVHGRDTAITHITIKLPENSPYTAADRQVREAALMKMYGMLNDFAYTVDCITAMQGEANKIAASLTGGDKLKKQLSLLAHDLDTLHDHLVSMKSGAIISESANRLREDLADNYGTLLNYDGQPNNSTLERINTLKKEMDTAEKTYQTIMNKYLPRINAGLKKDGQPEITRKPRADFDKT